MFALVRADRCRQDDLGRQIAAQYALRHGLGVGLIGIDTYRVAGQDQLRRYGDLIGINVHIVHDVRGLVDTLAMLVDKRLVQSTRPGWASATRGSRRCSRICR
ncbi:MAG: hypothetical protein R3E68_06790 [Burkholderiaceae bacterium]